MRISLDELASSVQLFDEGCSGRLGVAATDLATGETLRWRHDEPFGTASTVKVAVHAAVMAEVTVGQAQLDQRALLREEDLAGGSGVLSVLHPGLLPTVADLCTLMIVVSDNTATNMLIDMLGGVARVNSIIAGLGFGEVVLHRRLEYPPPPLVAGPRPAVEPPTTSCGTATPASLCRLASSLWRGDVVDPQASQAVIATLAHQQSHWGVPRSFLGLSGPGETPQRWPGVANKTGSFPRCRAEVGIISLPGGRHIAYAVMADDLSDTTMTCLSEGDELLGRVGAAFLYRWWDGPGAVPVRAGWPAQASRAYAGPVGA